MEGLYTQMDGEQKDRNVVSGRLMDGKCRLLHGENKKATRLDADRFLNMLTARRGRLLRRGSRQRGPAGES